MKNFKWNFDIIALVLSSVKEHFYTVELIIALSGATYWLIDAIYPMDMMHEISQKI